MFLKNKPLYHYSFGGEILLYKMERVKSMLVGFGFLGFALLLKSVYPGRNMVFLGAIIVFLVLGPILVSYRGKIHAKNLVKT
jgi:hypothetical protein